MNTEACEVDIEDDRKMRSTEKTERWWTLEKTNAQNDFAADAPDARDHHFPGFNCNKLSSQRGVSHAYYCNQ